MIHQDKQTSLKLLKYVILKSSVRFFNVNIMFFKHFILSNMIYFKYLKNKYTQYTLYSDDLCLFLLSVALY